MYVLHSKAKRFIQRRAEIKYKSFAWCLENRSILGDVYTKERTFNSWWMDSNLQLQTVRILHIQIL